MHRILAATVALWCLITPPAWGMGEESFGNAPVAAANYESFPGVLPVINDPHRVYRWWVNGNEKFFFRGDTIDLNAALQDFSKIDSPKLEVVLRPGPALTTTFQKDKQIPYNWHLHLIGGIAGHLSKEQWGENVWPTHPILYVYLGGKIQLSELQIPENVTVLQLSDLRDRYAKALQSSNQSVRGWACGELASLNPYDTEALTKIAKMLADENHWVRLNAASAVAVFGRKAKPVLPALESARLADQKALNQRIDETVKKLNAAPADDDRETPHAKMLQAIAQFCAARDTR